MVETTSKHLVSMALALHGELVLKTPVDTGWARASWIPSIGKPASGTGGTEDAISSAQSQMGAMLLLTWKPEKGPVYISNNVPYISRLNDGHSHQAPAGFVEAAVDRVLLTYKGKVLS